MGYARNDGHLPKLYFYFIAFPFLFWFIYSAIVGSFIIGKVIYSIESSDNNLIHFTSCGRSWRNEKEIIADKNSIIIDSIPQPKLLYEKFILHTIYIDDKKIYIIDSLLNESNLADELKLNPNGVRMLTQEDLKFIFDKEKKQNKVMFRMLFCISFGLLLLLLYLNKINQLTSVVLWMLPVYLISLYPVIIRRLVLNKMIYGIDKLDNNKIQLATFSYKFPSETSITTNLSEIQINENIAIKKLYKTFDLREILVNGKKYKIFSKLSIETKIFD